MKLSLGLDLPSVACRGSLPWWAGSAYLLDAKTPTLAMDFVRGFYASSGGARALTDLVSISSDAKWVIGSDGLPTQVSGNTVAFGYGTGRRRMTVEGASTNNFTQNGTLSSWTPSNMSVSAGAGFGGLSSVILNEGTATAVHSIASNSISISTSTVYTISAFAKAGTGRYLQVLGQTAAFGATNFASFDLQTGTVVNSAVGTPYITSIGNGWYLIEFVLTASGAGTYPFYFAFGDGSGTKTPSFTGTSKTINICAPQLAAEGRATSRIVTGASAVARAADIISLTATGLAALDATKGTMVFRGYSPYRSSQARALRAAGPGAQPAVIGHNSNNTVIIGGSTVGALSLGSVTSTYGASAGWDAAGRAGSLNGAAVVSDTATMSFDFTTFTLGGNSGPPTGSIIYFDEVVAWAERGTDAALLAQARVWA